MSVRSFDLGIEPHVVSSAILWAFGSIWVSTADAQGCDLLRLDPSTGKRIVEIELPVGAVWEKGGSDLIASFGGVWLVGNSAQGMMLIRVDPSTERFLVRARLGPDRALNVTATAGSIWVLSIPMTAGARARVSRIDPMTGAVAASVQLSAQDGHFFFESQGRVVAAMGNPDGPVTLDVIDPATNKLVRQIPTGATGATLTPSFTGKGSVWVLRGEGIVSIDVATGEVSTPIHVANTWPSGAAGNGGVWFFSERGGNAPILHRLNPTTEAVDFSQRWPSGLAPIAMALSPGVVWVLNYSGTVTRVALPSLPG